LDIKCVMDALQRAVPIPQHEVGMRGAFRRQILRQRLPLAARREYIEDRVQNLADVHLAPAPTVFGRWYRWFDQRPLAVAQIAWVAQAVAVGSTAMFRLRHPSAAIRVPEKESQPIPPTQQLCGSALRQPPGIG